MYYTFLKKSVEVVCLLLVASLFCVKCQGPENKAIRLLKALPGFTNITLSPFSAEDKKAVADAVNGNTELHLDDLDNFDLAAGYILPEAAVSERIWTKDVFEEDCRRSSPSGSQPVSEEDYAKKTKLSVDEVCLALMVDVVEDLHKKIADTLKSKSATNLSVGVERVALQVGGDFQLYSVVFFKAT